MVLGSYHYWGRESSVGVTILVVGQMGPRHYGGHTEDGGDEVRQHDGGGLEDVGSL